MSLVEQQPRDRVDFIPDSLLERQEQDRKSYRSSRSSSPEPPSTPSDTNESENNMDQLNNDEMSNGINNNLAPAPALPPRSSLRASRLLATMPLKLSTEERPVLTPAAPHILYLSSEEDASSSADDFSDCDYSSDGEQSEQLPVEQSPHEDIARIVSVIFSGKPSVVQVARRAPSPSSSDGPVGGLLRTSTEPVLGGRKYSEPSSLDTFHLPPRSSSMLDTTHLDRQRHSFLHMDPFAQKVEAEESEALPRKTTNMFQRTLSLVRKRSKPNLHQAAMQSRDSVVTPVPSPLAPMELVEEEKAENHTSVPRSMTPNLITVQETMNMSKRTSYAALPSPMAEASPSKRLRPGFLTRRRTIRV